MQSPKTESNRSKSKWTSPEWSGHKVRTPKQIIHLSAPSPSALTLVGRWVGNISEPSLIPILTSSVDWPTKVQIVCPRKWPTQKVLSPLSREVSFVSPRCTKCYKGNTRCPSLRVFGQTQAATGCPIWTTAWKPRLAVNFRYKQDPHQNLLQPKPTAAKRPVSQLQLQLFLDRQCTAFCRNGMQVVGVFPHTCNFREIDQSGTSLLYTCSFIIPLRR